jgi:hypothetical protein
MYAKLLATSSLASLAILAPVSVQLPSASDTSPGRGGLIAVNRACASGGPGCKFSIKEICETSNGNERFYRNKTGNEDVALQ